MMDTQDHRKISTPGNEGHEVHFCHKCGWPFPNPHPSAKHRRAHKKVCGRVEGYQLVGSEETSHLAVSDGEQHSDEDLKTPSPKPQERSDNGKGSGLSVGFGERSNKSEEEVFSDAVAEFIDSGSSHGIEEQLEDIKEPAIQVQTISDACAQTSQLNEDRAVGDINTPLFMSAERSHIQSTEVQGCNISESAQGSLCHISKYIGLTEIALVDGLTGKSTTGTSLVKVEAQPDALLESKEENAGKDLADSDGQVDEGNNLDQEVGVVALPVVHADKKSEVVCESGKSDDITPGPILVDGVVKSNEGDTVGIAQMPDMDGSGNSTEDHNGNEAKEVMHVLSVPDKLPAVDNAEIIIKGFKDHERRNLPGFVDADSFEIVNDVQDSVPEDNSSSFLSRPFEEGAKVSALDMDVLHAYDELEGKSNEVVFGQFTGGGESAGLQSNYLVNSDKISKESIACENNGAVEMEKSHNVVPPQHAMAVISDVDPVVTPKGGKVEQTTSGKDDADDGISRNYGERTTEKGYSEDMISHSEPATVHSLMPTGTDLFGDECAAYSEDKIKRYEESGSETGKDGSVSVATDASPSKKSKTFSESASELYVSSQNVIGASEDKFPEPEYSRSDIISDTKEGLKEHESCDNDKVQIEHVGDVSVVAQSSDGAVELIQKPTNNEMTNKPVICPLDTSSLLHNAANFEDDHCKNLVGVASRSVADSLLNENDQNLVIQQVGASAADLAVDSSSQTDSMEGQCGSISVHSTQSEYPAFAASDPQPANGCQETAETSEKVSLNKPKSLSATQHSDKSDLFEPPSFMTLVEPRGVGGQSTATSEVQKVENPQAASSLQAGWFPSVNHVVNETQGRKKNEEIIAKVTNWSTGKQQVPIKSLLGEGIIETKPKSPNAKENQSSVVQKDESIKNDGGAVAATTPTVLGPQAAIKEPAKKEEGKEWNSPARYPAEVKREKRKVKGRPYWAQFVCCSSVN